RLIATHGGTPFLLAPGIIPFLASVQQSVDVPASRTRNLSVSRIGLHSRLIGLQICPVGERNEQRQHGEHSNRPERIAEAERDPSQAMPSTQTSARCRGAFKKRVLQTCWGLPRWRRGVRFPASRHRTAI